MDNRIVLLFAAVAINFGHLLASQNMNCAQGYWGTDCKNACPEGCSSVGCDKAAGSCFGCDSGYHVGISKRQSQLHPKIEMLNIRVFHIQWIVYD
ncbi:uncharacterized protein LOC128558480 isoform X2 [Mercenaria mercenaria]|uniref:uncharacterized protein LOC128558480 isoform X2 n=1 Tax=Mercenaria mercenaria TaxID=6596 RepID=UPI00234F7D74|nr:uncharacterized protein LOC128558480 isoform X2 [Mercenaria mercenaria]